MTSTTKHLYSLLFILASALCANATCKNSAMDEITNINGKWQNCKWIRKNIDRLEICKSTDVSTACPQSCGLCCEDSTTFKFPLKRDNTIIVGCNWIDKKSQKMEKRRRKYCTKPDGKLADFYEKRSIRDACPVACNFCFEANREIPSMSPASSPSAVPAAFPSESPSVSSTPSVTVSPSTSGSPSVSLGPSVDPTVSPTANPSSDPSAASSESPSDPPTESPSYGPSATCADSTSFQFKINYNGTLKGCGWILKNKDLNRTEKRVKTYCANATILAQCQRSCRACP